MYVYVCISPPLKHVYNVYVYTVHVSLSPPELLEKDLVLEEVTATVYVLLDTCIYIYIYIYIYV